MKTYFERYWGIELYLDNEKVGYIHWPCRYGGPMKVKEGFELAQDWVDGKLNPPFTPATLEVNKPLYTLEVTVSKGDN